VDPAFRGEQYGIVLLGDGSEAQRTPEAIPGDLVLDRVYVHGGPNTDTMRCVALNSKRTGIIDSYLSECHSRHYDAQAIAGWNGPGPFKIVNNMLMGSGENVLFGGAWSAGHWVPSDIEIRRNYIYTPATWRNAGWIKKFLVEFKSAQRVLVEGNVLDGSWAGAGGGYAFMMWTATEMGKNLRNQVADITMRNNLIRNVGAGWTLSDGDAYCQCRYLPTSRILIEQNILTMNASAMSGDGRALALLGRVRDVTVRRNSFDALGSHNTAITVSEVGPRGFELSDNVFSRGDYGFHRDGGLPFAEAFAGAVVWGRNALYPSRPDDGPAYSVMRLLAVASLAQAERSGLGANRAAVLAATRDVAPPP
jgi:hypothetical protein